MRNIAALPILLALPSGLWMSSCNIKPPHVVLKVEDADGAASGVAVAMHVGLSTNRMASVDIAGLDEPISFPFTIAVEAEAPGEKRLWVEALGSDARTVARGSTNAIFDRRGTPTAVVALRKACVTDLDCSDDAACNGIEACRDGECVFSTPPCDDDNDNPNDGCDACRLTVWDAEVISGAGIAEGNPLYVNIYALSAVATDRTGNIYLADPIGAHIWRIDSGTSTMTVLAGNGMAGAAGVGLATAQPLGIPTGIAADRSGNIYVAEREAARILKIDRSGTVTVVAGTIGTPGDPAISPEDDVPATETLLAVPSGVAVDGLGHIYISEETAGRIRRIDADSGRINTVVDASDGLSRPSRLTVDARGHLYVCDSLQGRIFRVQLDTQSTTLEPVAGGGGYFPDATNALEADIGSPFAVARDGASTLYFAELITYQRVFRVDLDDGTIHVIAGNGNDEVEPTLGVPATDSAVRPSDIAIDVDGRLLIADAVSARLLRVGDDGILEAVAGRSMTIDGLMAGLYLLAPGGLTPVNIPGIGLGDGLGLSVAITAPQAHMVFLLADYGQTVVRIAGTGKPGYDANHSGGPAREATLDTPQACATDAAGNIYVVEEGNARVRVLKPAASDSPHLHQPYTIHEFAGCDPADTGCNCVPSDATPCDPVTVPLSRPAGVTVDPSANAVYIADTGAHRILKVVGGGAGGGASVVMGTGEAGFAGDGVPHGAAEAQLNEPRTLIYHARLNATLDIPSPIGPGLVAANIEASNVLLIADRANHRVRAYAENAIAFMVGAPTGWEVGPMVITVVGEDGSFVPTHPLHYPRALGFDQVGNLLIIDRYDRVQKLLLSSGELATTHGGREPSVDGQLEIARFAAPEALAPIDDAGAELIVSDRGLGTLRLVQTDNDARVSTVAGFPCGHQIDGGEATTAQRLAAPAGVAFDAETGYLYVSESGNNSITRVDTTANPWTLHPFIADRQMHVPGNIGAPAEAPELSGPTGLLVAPCSGGQDPCGSCTKALYIADTDNHVVHRVELSGAQPESLIVAGTLGVRGFDGHGDDATKASLDAPQALAIGPEGSLFVADTGNHAVRRVGCDGRINIVIGNGDASSAGSGFPASTVPLDSPGGLAVDPYGNLLVTSGDVVRLVTADPNLGVATGNSSVINIYGQPPRNTYPEAVTHCLSDVLMRSDGTVVVLDRCAGYVIQLRQRTQ